MSFALLKEKRPPEAKENGLPRQCEHWLAMTGQGQRAGAIGGDADGQAVPFGFFSATMTPTVISTAPMTLMTVICSSSTK